MSKLILPTTSHIILTRRMPDGGKLTATMVNPMTEAAFARALSLRGVTSERQIIAVAGMEPTRDEHGKLHWPVIEHQSLHQRTR